MAAPEIIPAPPADAPLRLLLVKLKHIGDALLLTPTLVAIRARYPKAEIWVVVRKGTESILAGCRAIDRLLTVAPPEADKRGAGALWHDTRVWRELRRQRFDYAFELTDGDRGRWLAGMSAARHRCVNVSRYRLNLWWKCWFNRTAHSLWVNGHRVEKDFHAVGDFLPLGDEIPPLCFAQDRAVEPDIIRGRGDYVVIHPVTRWKKKRWPKEHWFVLCRALLKRTKTIIVSCGPDEEERAFAAELVAELGADRALNVDGCLDWAGLAGILYRARLFVGVDTAAMHLAAACQCPIVTFFAISVVSQWSPWKVRHETLSLHDRMSYDDMVRLGAPEVMLRLTPEMALAAVDRLMRPAADS